jgi:16S rRNA (cytosine967-C5)-methyltransferase
VAQQRFDAERDRSLLAALCYGGIRWYARLDAIIGRMLSRPLKAADTDIRALLALGIYQLEFTRVPAHAAVSATVDATRVLGKPWARGLTNALLRRYQRERAALNAAADRSEPARWAHPQWWIDAIRDDWPDDWQRILDTNNSEPPMWLRVATRRIPLDDYRDRLEMPVASSALPYAGLAGALRLRNPVPVADLPGFEEGLVSVQDAGAQLAAGLLEAGPGMRVLDACAAPGGKTGHVLQDANDEIHMTALDIDGERLGRVAQNLERLGVAATLVEADATAPEQWWDGQRFDRILLDAPCTASGVIRRHPDIKLLRQPGDIAATTSLQQRLLLSMWALLKPGGRLLYCTCSVLRAENDANIAAFLAAVADAETAVPVFGNGRAPWRTTAHGVQILPGDADMDGFYYACLTKRGNSE